ncbi:MAG: phosphoribosyltransferase family protein [Coriobacteriales bacterium]|nr:ComF family protein [Actinomycetes bacterium]
MGPLETPLSRVITVYKDGGERRYAALLGDLLAHAVEEWQGWPEAVVAVPPTRTARRRRGFDHTLPLARAVAVTLDAPVVTLLAVGARRDQRDLGRVARLENMSGAFTVIGDGPVPRRIVLVDDVMTTGATLDAASEALLAAGAEEVRAAVLAHA